MSICLVINSNFILYKNQTFANSMHFYLGEVKKMVKETMLSV